MEQLTPPQQKLIPPVLQSVATMTETRGDWSPFTATSTRRGSSRDAHAVDAHSSTTEGETGPQTHHSDGARSPPTTTTCWPIDDTATYGNSPAPFHFFAKSGECFKGGGHLGPDTSDDPRGQGRPLLDLNEETLWSLLKDSTGLQSEPGTMTQTSSSQSSVTTPSVTVRRPTSHVNTLYKVKNWSHTVRHKWLILGDSNVSRFPPYNIPQLQIDSFRGTTFMHLKGVLDKLERDPKVKILILSLGINNRTQKSPETSIGELRKLLPVAKSS